MDITEKLVTTTEAMANLCSAPMDLWNEHSNAALKAAATITALRKRVEELEGAATTHQRTLEALREAEKALEQARLYIERDEAAHGRQFGDGNAVRAALARIKEATDGR